MMELAYVRYDDCGLKASAQDAEHLAGLAGLSFDYTEKSLEDVDALLRKLVGDGVFPPRNNEEEEQLWTLAQVYGAYLGEVVIQNLGGAWEVHQNPDGTSRVVLRSLGVQMFPLEKIYKRLAEDRFSSVSGYCRVIRAIIVNQEKSQH